jgi:WD40 repeat protein
MKPRTLLTTAITALGLVSRMQADDKVTYNDQILPLFRNACLNCHNPDKKKAGLDLSTYQAALMGSDNGKVLESGNASGSLLMKCVKQTDDPKMPPKGDKLSDAEIALLEKWVTGQLLESKTGKAVAVSNNVQTVVVSLDRPAGPPPMPAVDLPLEPLYRTKTANALVAMAASPWAPLVAIGGQKQIILYNTDTLQPLGILPFPEGFPAIIRFSRNGQVLLTGGGLGGKLGKVVLWNVADGERIGEVGNEFDQVLGADISPDHAHVALGGPTRLLKIYSTKDGKLEISIKKHTDWITAVAFSPDGKFLASADRNGGISVWEGVTGREFNALPGHKAGVTGLAFMPGVLASASEDGRISLWDVKEAKEIRGWVAHAGGVESVDFTTDGRIVSSGRDKIAKAWDQTGKLLLSSEPFNDIALRAVLSNERVIAGDWTGQIRVFNLADGKPLGELSSNPLPISDHLATAEKQLADGKAQAAALQTAIAADEAKVKSELAAVEEKRKADLAALTTVASDAQKEIEAVNASATDLEKQLGTEKWALTALVGAQTPPTEKAAAQAKIAEQKQKVDALEKQLAKAKADSTAKLAASRKKADDASAALAALQKSPIKLWPTPQSVAEMERLQKKLATQNAELAKLSAKAQVEAKKAEIAQTQQALQVATVAASSAPIEQELAKAQAALQQANAVVASATSDVQRWQRAQAFMGVHRAKQSLVEIKSRFDELVAAAKDALAPVDKIQADIAASEKAIPAAAAIVKDAEAQLPKLRSNADALKKTVASAETISADKEAKAKAATTAADTAAAAVTEASKPVEKQTADLTKLSESTAKLAAGSPERTAADAKVQAAKTELAKAQASLDAAKTAATTAKAQSDSTRSEAAAAADALTKLTAEAKAAAETAAKTEEALTTATATVKTETAKLAEMRQKAPGVLQSAKLAKAKAEQDAATTSKQLDEAKAQAERVRTEYESRYRAAAEPGKPAPAKPLASS